MGTDDKAKRESKNLSGKLKAVTGRVRRDKPLENEGKREQKQAQLKKAGSSLKKAFKK
jgi:uncharacterized protein YjbJ (UPF0337 family)